MQTARTPLYSTGELLVAADWASAHGDGETIAHIAKTLAARFTGSLHDDLLAIAEQIVHDDECAPGSWTALRVRLRDEIGREPMS